MGPLFAGFLLQTDYVFFQEADSTSMIIAGVAIVGFVLFLVVMNAAGGGGSGGRRNRNGEIKVRTFSFLRRARRKGLPKQHARLLLDLVKRHRVRYPYRVLENSPSLDLILKREIAALDEAAVSEAVREARKVSLFRIKQTLERNAKRFSLIGSTRQLRKGHDLRITASGRQPWRVQIEAITGNMLVVTAPRTESGAIHRLPKGTPIRGELPRGPNDLYSFSTRVLGYGRSRGESVLSLEHSAHVTRVQNRRFRRKTLTTPVSFSPVQIVETGVGRRRSREAVIGARRLMGNLMDISAGGCCIQTHQPLDRGNLLKLEFHAGAGDPITVFGKVRHTRPGYGRGTMMHIMFTKISRKNLNAINSYVYSYQET